MNFGSVIGLENPLGPHRALSAVSVHSPTNHRHRSQDPRLPTRPRATRCLTREVCHAYVLLLAGVVGVDGLPSAQWLFREQGCVGNAHQGHTPSSEWTAGGSSDPRFESGYFRESGSQSSSRRRFALSGLRRQTCGPPAGLFVGLRRRDTTFQLASPPLRMRTIRDLSTFGESARQMGYDQSIGEMQNRPPTVARRHGQVQGLLSFLLSLVRVLVVLMPCCGSSPGNSAQLPAKFTPRPYSSDPGPHSNLTSANMFGDRADNSFAPEPASP